MFVKISYSVFMSCHFGVFTACTSPPVRLQLIPCVCVPKRKSMSIFHWSALKAIHGWKKQLMGTSRELNAVMFILVRIITDFCNLLPKALFSSLPVDLKTYCTHTTVILEQSQIKYKEHVCVWINVKQKKKNDKYIENHRKSVLNQVDHFIQPNFLFYLNGLN